MLESAQRLNRLEALHGNREGQWSIRVNDPWRICFQWGAAGPEEVEVVNYHSGARTTTRG